MNHSHHPSTITRTARREGSGRLIAFLLVVALAFGTVLFGAANASAQEQRLHQINWAHPTPSEVRRFVILISPVEGSIANARQVDVGKPAATVLGSTSVFSAMVSFEADEFLAVAAVGYNGQMSTPSDWSGMPPTAPGQPLPIGN